MPHFLKIIGIQPLLINWKYRLVLYFMKFAILKFKYLKKKLVLNTDINYLYISLFVY